MARIETLKPFVEQLIFGIDVDAKRSGSRYGFHLDYETKIYREKALAGLIRDSVEYFALTHEEFEEFIQKGDLISARRKAWGRISTAHKNKKGDWSLVQCLERGVAFHHGAMPRYIQSHIVDSFNNREIQTLVCTTTLTEGVNTTAKNVVLYSNKKGSDVALTAFDYKNLKGRAGRFLQHFVGKVIAFHPVVEGERDLISYYYYDGDDIGSSEVISIDESDLTAQSKQKRERVLEILKKENLPIYIVKANKYIPVEKQIPFVNRLRRDKALLQTLVFHGNLPDKVHLDLILDLCHEYLFSKRDFESQNFPIGNLKRLVKYYVYQRPSLKALILTQNGATIDTRVRNAFSLISHFFEFALPKYLTCFENLFNFVAQENRASVIKLGYVTTTLQYGFTEPHQIALKDAGVPDGIIEKIGDKLNDCRTSEEIRLRLRINPKILDLLSSFEQKMLRKLI
jgi:hypothetical protein